MTATLTPQPHTDDETPDLQVGKAIPLPGRPEAADSDSRGSDGTPPPPADPPRRYGRGDGRPSRVYVVAIACCAIGIMLWALDTLRKVMQLRRES